MTLQERSGERDLAYSRWHRPESIGRFLPRTQARTLTAIDVDSIEVCQACSRPLMLLEVARDVGQTFKPTTILVELARRSDVPAALVFYLAGPDGDIARFRVRQLAPNRTRELVLYPREYAAWLQSLRERHTCTPAPTKNGCGFTGTSPLSRRLPRPNTHPAQFRIPETVQTLVSPSWPLE